MPRTRRAFLPCPESLPRIIAPSGPGPVDTGIYSELLRPGEDIDDFDGGPPTFGTGPDEWSGVGSGGDWTPTEPTDPNSATVLDLD